MVYTHVEKSGPNFVLATDYPRAKELPPGIYQGTILPTGPVIFSPLDFKSDGLINLDDTVGNKIDTELAQFWNAETKAKYGRYKMLYKRGVLLYGAPGTGKTSIMVQAARRFVEQHHGIVLFNPDPRHVARLITGIRQIQKDQHFLVIFEEFEDHLDNHEAVLLSLLDGEVAVDNVLYMASTNYIEQVPPRIKNRPSRFASVIEVGPPNATVRRGYLEQKIMPEDRDSIELENLVSKTEGFTLDHIKDVLLSMVCFNQPMNSAVEKVQEMINNSDD